MYIGTWLAQHEEDANDDDDDHLRHSFSTAWILEFVISKFISMATTRLVCCFFISIIFQANRNLFFISMKLFLFSILSRYIDIVIFQGPTQKFLYY